jgi:hypothetical protein
VGGRFGYRIHRKVIIEGELAYGYGINFHEAFRNMTNGDITAIERTSIGVTHGMFGPTLQPATGRLRPFVTLKGGFMDFRLSPSVLPLSPVESTLLGIRTSSLNVAMYPGAGVEANLVRWGCVSNWATTSTSTTARITTCGLRLVRSSGSEFSRQRWLVLNFNDTLKF